MLNKINSFVTDHNLIPKDATIVIGLSGGPDSMFLLYYLCDLHKQGHVKKLVAAHLDHEWRPDSANDAKFCQEQTSALGIECVVQKMSQLDFSLKFDGSKEAYARHARRYFLERVKKEHHADTIALAHHLQDQQETFFIRLIRGSSLTGLTAMRAQYGDYIRPLLQINKNEILNYLTEKNIPFLVDPTNEQPTFLRNRIRANVLPALQQCDDRFDANFLVTLNRLKKTEQLLEVLTQKTFDEITKKENDIIILDTQRLLSLHQELQYRILLHWLITQHVPFPPSQSFLDEILRFFAQPGSKEHKIHDTWKIIKKKHRASIEPV